MLKSYRPNVIIFACYFVLLELSLTVSNGQSNDDSTCWWSGCQPNTWAVQGCNPAKDYIQKAKEDCLNGSTKFQCCPIKTDGGGNNNNADPTEAPKPCWWSGCQPVNWAVQGCPAKDYLEKDREDCHNSSIKYQCCPFEGNYDLGPQAAPISCYWTGCQPFNWAVRGCPANNTIEYDSRDCDKGEEFQCCDVPPDAIVDDSYKTHDLPDYKAYVKYLLLSANNFSVAPDRLECTDVDPDKNYVLAIGDDNEGIRFCDLCPKLPQTKLRDVVINRQPMDSVQNTGFQDCFALCIDKDNCVALSYDELENVCYIYDSTVGQFRTQRNWTTILVNQPIGIVRNWIYSRHTKITGTPMSSPNQLPNYLSCLQSCQDTTNCGQISYSFLDQKCQLFQDSNSDGFFELEYGSIVSFKNDLSHRNSVDDISWRFKEYNDLFKNQTIEDDDDFAGKGNTSSSVCKQPTEVGLASNYASQCVTAGGLGCDRLSGCKTCYYPELARKYREDLTICEDSKVLTTRLEEQKLQECFEKCLQSVDCMFIDFDPKNNYNCDLISLEKFTPLDLTNINKKKRYFLEFPNETNSNKNNLYGYSLVLGHDLEPIGGTTGGMYQKTKANNWNQCLELCNKDSQCIKASFVAGTCQLASNAIRILDKRSDQNNGANVFIKKPKLTSNEMAFKRTPGWFLDAKDAIQTSTENCKDCGPLAANCLQKCLNDYKDFCGFVSVEYYPSQIICHYFNEGLDGTLSPDPQREVYTKFFDIKFELETLNNISIFQAEDVNHCFDSSQTQTQSSLNGYQDPYQTVPNDNNDGIAKRSLRVRRGNAFVNFFKKIGKGIKDFVVGTANKIKDTVVGVGKTIANVAQGKFDKAKESFLNIPIVKDVKEFGQNVVKFGKSVVKGDLEGIKDAGLGLISSDVLDFIPGGKIIGTGGKILKGIAKGSAKAGKKDIGKDTKKKVDGKVTKDRDPNPKNNKDDKDRPDSKKKCNRPKRQTALGKRGRVQPGKGDQCDSDDDDDDNQKCVRPSLSHVIRSTLDDCHLRIVNKKCLYECNAGYDEGKVSTCKKATKARASWVPGPKCEPADCGKGPFPLIAVQVPPVDKTLRALGPTTAYVILLDKSRRLPIWSTAVHDKLNRIFSVKRKDLSGDFHKHPCLTDRQQANSDDYKYSGWDQGHLTPANVMLFSAKALLSSNLFINVAPQDFFTNRGYWAVIEAQVQCFTGRVSSLVATGICPGSNGKTNAGGIEIPSCYWKMVCYHDKDKAGNAKTFVVGFISDNTKPNGDAGKAQRRAQVGTPVSQSAVKLKMGKNALYDPWTMASPYLFKGRPGIFPVNPIACAAALNLDPDEENEWKASIKAKTAKKKKVPKPAKTPPKKKTGRRKRQAVKREQRGCSPSEARDMAVIFGLGTLNMDDITDEDLIDPNAGDDGDDGDGPLSDGGSVVPASSCGKRVIGYYPSWGKNKFQYEQAQKLTHVVYAFLEMKSDGTIVVGSPDPNNSPNVQEDADLSNKRLKQMLKVARAFAHLKVMFAIGGWENSQYFSSVCSTPSGRIGLIANIIKQIDEWGFDGVDLDWEYPVTGGAHEGVPADKANYVQLMKELREALDQHSKVLGNGQHYLISFAGAAGQWTLDPGFDLPGILKYADWANVMTYDFFGAWESKWGAYTGPPAPLFFGMPPRYSGKTNVDWTMKYYVCRSQMPHKINMGVPFYGRYWKNVGDPVDGKDGMWRTAQAVNGKFVGGYVGWRDIPGTYLNDPGFVQNFHEKAKAPYAFNAATKTYLGYENQKSLKLKAQYAAAKNLGGIMIWAIDQDDDDLSMLDSVYDAALCDNTDPKAILHKCSPITEKRWWTSEDGDDKAGLCGRSAPLYKGYYPVCDPDDPGYSCCGEFGYCGFGDTFCKCKTCVNYGENPEKILDAPVKPTVAVQWYFLNAPEGQRGRCGRKAPKLNGIYPICNPDDQNAHCCSNGNYCGASDGFCKCEGCIDFKANPGYRFKPKRWWDFADGKEVAGKCGPKAPKVDGFQAECDPDTQYYCCSDQGNCGKGKDFCDCKGCVNYKK